MKPKPYPNNPEAEKAVLGSVLLDNQAFNKIEGFIQKEDFYITNNQIIFEIIQNMINKNQYVDLVTISNYAEKSGLLEKCGGPSYLMDLLEATPTAQVIVHYAEIIKDKSNQRKVIKKCQNAFDQWDMLKPSDLLTGFGELITEIQDSSQEKEIFTPIDLNRQVMEIHEKGGLLSGVQTPWSNLSRLYTIRKGLFTVITGAPSSGKSCLLDNIIVYLAEQHQWRTVIFSPENYPLGFYLSSLIEKYSGYPITDKYSEKISHDGIKYAMEFLNSYIVFLQPRKAPTIENIFALTKIITKKRNIDCLVIDPYNMLNNSRDIRLSETEYIGTLLRKVREFSRKQGIHIFIIAHPRKLLKRRDGNFEPATAYDISGSSHWFNSADYILSMWRDLMKPENPVKVYVQKVRFRELGRPGCAKLIYHGIDGHYTDYYPKS